jgi:hypothetical protein
MTQLVMFSGWYSEKLCKQHPDVIFVFGDNVRGVGCGGQAVIRYEPNAFGVPTKRIGTMNPGAFFHAGDSKDIAAVAKALDQVERFLEGGGRVVIPVTKDGEISLGLERARLKEVAPDIYQMICAEITGFADKYGAVFAKDGDQLIQNRRT